MEIFETIFIPLQYPFMVKAIIVSSFVGVVCAMLSCFLVLKGWSLLGDAISHAVLPGVVFAYIFAVPFFLGAFVFSILSVLLIGIIKDNSKIKEDAVMGIVFTTFFALGLILISKTASSVDLMHVLFGYVLGIANQDAWITVIMSIIIGSTIFAFRRTLLLFSFDPMHTQSIGIPVRVIHYFLLILLATTITISLQTVGIILVIAMLITPGSTAFLLTKKFPKMLIIATSSSVISSLAGAYGSYYLDVSTGGLIVFIQGLIFLLAFVFSLIKTRHSRVNFGRTSSPLINI